jgi:hypothetical protein
LRHTAHETPIGATGVAAGLLLLAAAAQAETAATQATPASVRAASGQARAEPFYDGLGPHSRKVTTTPPLAQRYFDQGLAFQSGFHHGAAIRRVYREDLKRLPNNGWSLFGLWQSLERQGQTEAAATARKQFETAWAKADTEIQSSCLCRPAPQQR